MCSPTTGLHLEVEAELHILHSNSLFDIWMLCRPRGQIRIQVKPGTQVTLEHVPRWQGWLKFYICSFEDLVNKYRWANTDQSFEWEQLCKTQRGNLLCSEFLCSMTFSDNMMPAIGILLMQSSTPGKIRTRFPSNEFNIKTCSERVFFRFSLKVVLGFMACHSWHDS